MFAIIQDDDIISTSEQAILHKLVSTENEYVMAAYEVYENDRDEEELKDTLLRIANIYGSSSQPSSGKTKFNSCACLLILFVT